MTRWVIDGLRLVSLAQAACESRGWDVKSRLAIVQVDRVQTFMLKRSPFTADEIRALRETADRLGFNILYAPQLPGEPAAPMPTEWVDGMETADYPRLILAADRQKFYDDYPHDLRPDHRRSPVLLPHDEARRISSRSRSASRCCSATA